VIANLYLLSSDINKTVASTSPNKLWTKKRAANSALLLFLPLNHQGSLNLLTYLLWILVSETGNSNKPYLSDRVLKKVRCSGKITEKCANVKGYYLCCNYLNLQP
jgi:hypothetical protein